MAIGKKFNELVVTTDIDALLGAAENVDGTTPGNKFTYSKTPNIASPSNAHVLTESAVVNLTPGTNIIYFGKGGNDSSTGLSWAQRLLTLPAAYTLAQTAFGTPSATNKVVCYCQDAGYYGTGGASAINFGLTQWISIYAPEATLAYSLYDPSGNRSITAKIIGASDLTGHTVYYNNSETCYLKAERLISNVGTWYDISITGSAQPTLYIDVKKCDSFIDHNTVDIATVYANFGSIGTINLGAVTAGSIFANSCINVIGSGNTACEIFCPNYVKSGHTIYVDGNRTDAYIPNGTEIMPYKTFSAAITAMGTPSVGFAVHIATGTYTEASLVTLPNVPIAIYGNEATITFAAGLTIQYPSYVINDLNIVGNVTMSSTAATGQGLSNGGSVTGNITYAGGRTGFKNTILLSGLVTVTSPAFFVANICTVTSQITGNGQIILENCQINTGKTTPLVTSTTGGTLIMVNCLVTNTSTGGGISCNNGANGITAINGISNCIVTVASGAPIACGTAVTIIVKCTVNGTPTGTGYIGSNFDIIGGGTVMGLGSDATGDMYYRAATTLLTRIAPNSTAAKMFLSQTSSGAPAWAVTEPYLASSNIIWFGKGGSDTNNGLSWGNRLLTFDAAYTLAKTAFGTLSNTNQAVIYCPDAGGYTTALNFDATYINIVAPTITLTGNIPCTSGNESFIILHKLIGTISFFNNVTIFLKINYLYGNIQFPANYGSTVFFDVLELKSFLDQGGTGNVYCYGSVKYLRETSTITSRTVGSLSIGKSEGVITNNSSNFAVRCDNYASQAYYTNYYNSTGVLASLAPNTTITPKFLQMVGDATNGAAPTWKEHQTYNSIFVTRFGTDNTELYVFDYTVTTGTGWINVAADFPTIAAVVDKGCYLIPNGVTVVDNDATKTNTGMSFTGPLQISAVFVGGAFSRWMRRTGKTMQDPICSIAVASYLNYHYGSTYGTECLDNATYNFSDQFIFYGNVHAPLATLNNTGTASIETTTKLSLNFNLLTSTPSDAFGTGGIWLTGSGSAYIYCNSARPLSDASPCKLFSALAGSLTVTANEIRNPNTTDYTLYTNGGSIWANIARCRGELYANSGTIYFTASISSSITTGGAGTIYVNNKLIKTVSVSTWVCAATASVPTTNIRLAKDMGTGTVTMSLDSWQAVGNSSTAGQIAASAVIPAGFRPTTGPVIGAIAAHDTDGIYSDVGSWGSVVIDSSGNIAIMKAAAYPVTGDWDPGTNNFGFYSSTIQWNSAQ